MSIAVGVDVYKGELVNASEAGPAPKRIVVGYGFWIFLLSDIVMFSALVCELRRAGKRVYGRSDRCSVVQSTERRDGNNFSAAL
jgi:heme/copper-type cytochrome/quinol oxidase subunit 3